MPLVTSAEMFKKAYDGKYAVGAFNVNNMEIIQGIVDAAKEENAPLILQVSAGARKYAKHIYLMKLVEAAVEDSGLPICLHLDHGDDFEICKSCVDGGFLHRVYAGQYLWRDLCLLAETSSLLKPQVLGRRDAFCCRRAAAGAELAGRRRLLRQSRQ